MGGVGGVESVGCFSRRDLRANAKEVSAAEAEDAEFGTSPLKLKHEPMELDQAKAGCNDLKQARFSLLVLQSLVDLSRGTEECAGWIEGHKLRALAHHASSPLLHYPRHSCYSFYSPYSRQKKAPRQDVCRG